MELLSLKYTSKLVVTTNNKEMKANELRIGNLVMLDGYLSKVYHIPDDEDYFEECQPIPVTEEWLVKFGFEKVDESYYVSAKFFELGIYLPGNCFFVHQGTSHEVILDYTLKYVHQLQNLYFALTGEELILTQN